MSQSNINHVAILFNHVAILISASGRGLAGGWAHLYSESYTEGTLAFLKVVSVDRTASSAIPTEFGADLSRHLELYCQFLFHIANQVWRRGMSVAVNLPVNRP